MGPVRTWAALWIGLGLCRKYETGVDVSVGTGLVTIDYAEPQTVRSVIVRAAVRSGVQDSVRLPQDIVDVVSSEPPSGTTTCGVVRRRWAASGERIGLLAWSLASDNSTTPKFVVLLPITHAPPLGDIVAIEIPPKVCEAIGLDDERSWIVVSEYNVTRRMAQRRSVSHSGPQRYVRVWIVPPGLFAKINAALLDLARTKKRVPVRR